MRNLAERKTKRLTVLLKNQKTRFLRNPAERKPKRLTVLLKNQRNMSDGGKKHRKRKIVMKHCFWQVNEISWRLPQLKSKGALDGTPQK